MDKNKKSNLLKKWLKHDYAPMVVAAGAILLVILVVYLFFTQGEAEDSLPEEGPALTYSQNIEIKSSGPGGQGRVRMSFYLESEETYKEVMVTKEHVIRDLIIKKLLAWGDEDIGSREGMELFKVELKKLIHKETGIPVENIYFYEFLIN